MLHRRWLWLIPLLAVTGGIAALAWQATRPADYSVEQTAGIDKYESHVPFFGEKTVSQSFTPAADTISRLDVLIVDFKRQAKDFPITLTLREVGSSETLREVTVTGSAVRDDAYLIFAFPPISGTQGKTFEFTLSAPSATTQAPYAIRLTDKQEVAFGYYRSVTQAFVWKEWLTKNKQAALTFAAALLFIFLFSWLAPRADARPPAGGALVLIILLAGAALQFNTIRYLAGDPGGDAYYYLVAADQLARGINPLSDWSFRLPFYSALLIPAVLPAVPDLLWGRIIGVLATAGIVVTLPLLAKSLGLRPRVGLAAAALLFLNTDFVMTSIRPRPHVVFTFLLLASMWLLFRLKTVRQAAVWGIVLGLMGMTRQEAFPAIAILGLAFFSSLLVRRLPVKEIIRYLAAASLPLLLLLLPYFYENIRQYGNPFDSPYFHQTDTPTAWDSRQLIGNLETARHKLARMYLPASEPGISRPIEHNLTLIMAGALVIYLLWHVVSRYRPAARIGTWPLVDIVSGIAAVTLSYALGQFIFGNGESYNQNLNIIFVAAGTVGLIELARVGRWRGAAVVSITLLQLAIAAWFNPIPRLFHQAYPILALAAAAALVPLFSTYSFTGWRAALRLSPLVAAGAFLGAAVLTNLDVAIDDLNYPAAPYFVATEAAEELEKKARGPVAAEVDYEQGDGIFSLHSYQQNKFALFQEDISPPEQWQWLCQRNVRYVVDNDDLSRFTILSDENFKNRFQFLFDKKTIGRGNQPFRISVHEITAREGCR